jgi:membrane protease YdiL (CAAX protease family)
LGYPARRLNVEESEGAVKKMVWGPWITAGFGILIGIVFLLTQTITVIVFAIVEYTSDPQLDPTQLVEKLSGNGLVLAVATCATAIVCIGLIFLIVKLRKGATIAEYLALIPVSGKTLFGLLVLTAGFIILSDCLTFLLGRPIVPQYQVEAYRTSVWPAVLWIAIVISAPAFEETFFRSFLFEGFRRSRISDTGAIVLTALAWTVVHVQYGAYELVTIFVLGVLLGIVRLKTGSLWSCLFMHSFLNLVSTIETAILVYRLEG